MHLAFCTYLFCAGFHNSWEEWNILLDLAIFGDVLGRVHRLVFWKHKNIKTYLSCPNIPEKYSTPSTGTKCKNIVLHIPFVSK
jgi:hypothetical protein